MAFIYKIVNLVNDKIYVGKTNLPSIQDRFKQHKLDSSKMSLNKRPLYSAMRKYGCDNFSIELLEECDWKDADEREKYWISKLDSYRNGYNATLGGDGKAYFDHDKIIELLKQGRVYKDIADEIGCSTDLVAQICKSDPLLVKIHDSAIEEARNKRKLSVAQINKDTDEILLIFSSLEEAAKWIYNNQLDTCRKSSNGMSSHIAQVCKGKRKTAYGYKWKYLD